jgi:hypothetical protein
VTIRCSGRPKNPTGRVDVRNSARNSFLRHRRMFGSSPRTIVIWETK